MQGRRFIIVWTTVEQNAEILCAKTIGEWNVGVHLCMGNVERNVEDLPLQRQSLNGMLKVLLYRDHSGQQTTYCLLYRILGTLLCLMRH